MLMLLCGGIEPLPSPDSMTRTEFQPLILKKGLKFVHQNIRGLSNNFGMFQEFIACHKKIDFFTLSETFLPSSNSNSKNLFSFDCCRLTI